MSGHEGIVNVVEVQVSGLSGELLQYRRKGERDPPRNHLKLKRCQQLATEWEMR